MSDWAPENDGSDEDADGMCDGGDNCPDESNPAQTNTDGDAQGDACDTDDDNDGVADGEDSAALDPAVCGDTDGDGCDDCSVQVDGFGPLVDSDPADDGADSDADNICDLGDDCTDVDGDGLGNGNLLNIGCVDPTTDSNDTDPLVCADTDADGCDDCSSGTWDPTGDETDIDGDGLCGSAGCDDMIPTCGADCTTHSDTDGQVDCLEEFCNTDPFDAFDQCALPTTEGQLGNALDTPGNRIVVGDMWIDGELTDFADGVQIRQFAGTVLTFTESDDKMFDLNCTGSLVDGLNITGWARTVIDVRGSNNRVQNTTIDGFGWRGIWVHGTSNAEVVGNTVMGGTSSPDHNRGAIVVENSTATAVVGNLLVDNDPGGLTIHDASTTFADHNTIADNLSTNTTAGIAFRGSDSSLTCLRNNTVTGNQGPAIWFDRDTTWDETAACTDVLDSGPEYGNNQAGNGLECCIENGCTPGCAGLYPSTGTLYSFGLDPLFSSTTVGDADFYCLGEPGLIDVAAPLDPSETNPDYDLNGAASGFYNGVRPDVGSREAAGALGCP